MRPTGLGDDGYTDTYIRSAELPSRKKALVVIAAIIAVLIAGIWWYRRPAGPGAHITECGFDKNGPYAKVRVSSLGGGLGAEDHERFGVYFAYDGERYAINVARVKVPVLGSTTVVLPGVYPPHVINSDGSGSITVEGRTVYRDVDVRVNRHIPDKWAAHHDLLASNGARVTAFRPKSAVHKPGQHGPRTLLAHKETLPDDLGKIGCYLDPPPDGWQ